MDSGDKRHGIDHNDLTQILRLVDYHGASGSGNALQPLETLPAHKIIAYVIQAGRAYEELHSYSGS